MLAYTTRSTSKTALNPTRCFVNINADRLDLACADNLEWGFELTIEGVRFEYRCNARELRNAFRNNNTDVMPNPRKYSFYLAWATGKIYNKISPYDRRSIFTLALHSRIECADSDVPQKKSIMSIKRGKYATASGSPTSVNPDRCFVNVNINRLAEAAQNQETWYFSFLIDEELYEYEYEANNLEEVFENAQVNIIRNTHYSIYIDWRTGNIYKTISPNDRKSVFQLRLCC